MKKAIILALMLMMAPVFADQCLTSVHATTTATNVTTGTNVQIAVTPLGSCSNGEISLELTYTNCSLTVNDPPSPGYYTTVSAGTTKTFTVTSGSAGVCTITARGTTTDGSVDDNAPITLEFVDPSIITATGVPNAVTVSQYNTFVLQVNLTNPQPSDLYTYYAISIPTGLVRTDGDSESASRTIYGGGARTLSWTIKHNSCFTGVKTIYFQLGDNPTAFSTDVTGNSSCGGSSGSNSSSGSNTGLGGLGLNGTTATKESKVFSANIGGRQSLIFTTVTTTGLTAIDIVAATSITGANLTLTPASKPSAALEPVGSGKVFSYFNITTENVADTDFMSIRMRFKLSTGWLLANNIDPTQVYLFRWNNNAWVQLNTTIISNDTNNYFFGATTPGFSTFAIAGSRSGSLLATAAASGPAIIVISPTDGQRIDGSTVNVQLNATGITLAAPMGVVVPGEGHFHVWVDDAREQSGAGTAYTYVNVSGGNHTLKVELKNGNYSSLNPPVIATVRFEMMRPAIVQGFAGDMSWIGYVVVILMVVGAGGYFFGVKHINFRPAKYLASKTAGAGRKDFMPQHFKEAIAKDVNLAKKEKSSIMSFFSKEIKAFKDVKIDFAPKKIEKFVAKAASTQNIKDTVADVGKDAGDAASNFSKEVTAVANNAANAAANAANTVTTTAASAVSTVAASVSIIKKDDEDKDKSAFAS